MRTIFKGGYKILGLMILAMIVSLSACTKPADAQKLLLTKKDSVISGVDTIATFLPGGQYEKVAFSLTCNTGGTGDTLVPQSMFLDSAGVGKWRTTSIKNIRTQTSDTNIIIVANGLAYDFEVNDPAVMGFRVIRLTTNYFANRKTFVYFRARRR